MSGTQQAVSTKLGEALDDTVRSAAREGKPPKPVTIEASAEGGAVSVGVEDADRLGALVGPVSARRTDGTSGNVGQQAEEAVRRLSYLQEPLAIIESEGKRARAILRSAVPRQTESGREYNEAVLQGGDSISIRRYRTDSGSRRKTVPSNVSRETLGRLADDLVEILKK
jgi:hypothetical protein